MASKNKVIMARLTTLSEDDGSFDIEFWQKIGPQGIFEAMWSMVKEVPSIKGKKNERQLRLQRSIECVKQNEI